jgi:hypothetical protein
MKRSIWARVGHIEWGALATELVVVFVGLFAALQVDDWRDRRAHAATETLYLRRLSEDLKSYISDTETIMPFLQRNHRAVEHVSASFEAGHILRGDTALFELGLIYVGHLPTIDRPRAAYDEMVASGMFARLGSLDLQKAVSNLYATQAAVESNFSWWRNQPLELERDLAPFVQHYSTGMAKGQVGLTLNEPERHIRFDFEQLRSKPEIRNGYYWATDTHSDWVEWSGKLLGLARTAEALVAKELARR